MGIGHLILYVPDVEAAVQFYETAFQFKPHARDKTGDYVELISDDVVIGFMSETAADAAGHPYVPLRADTVPPAMEIVLERAEVLPAYIRALVAGATSLHEPQLKPSGQLAAFVRDLNGVIVELCTPLPAEAARVP